jgi:hypothetical protein
VPPNAPRAVRRFGIDVRLSLAMVPAFAPVGWDAAHYERHLSGLHDPLAEVQAWHHEHWPDVRDFADFADHLDLPGWDTAAWAGLIAAAGAMGVAAADSLAPPPTTDRLPFSGMRLDLDRACALRMVDRDSRRHLVFTRGLGPSTAWNQAETEEDRLDGAGIVALLAILASLGKHLTLAIGPLPDGAVPSAVAAPLLAAGRWLAANADAVDEVEPFDVTGDDQARYTSRSGLDGTREVFVIDLVGEPVRELPHFSPHRYPVVEVDGAATWEQGPAGLRIVARPSSAPIDPGGSPATVYRLTMIDKRARSLAVHGERAGTDVRIGDRRFPTIGHALAAARPGDLVDVAAGRYGSPAEVFPLVVPPGVTIVGHEPTDPAADPPTIDAADVPFGVPAVELRDGSAIAGMTVVGRQRLHGPSPGGGSIASRRAVATTVERCSVHGSIAHEGGRDHVVEFCTISGGRVATLGADRVTVTGNRITAAAGPGSGWVRGSFPPPPDGTPTEVGIHVVGGSDHRIDANTIDHVRCGIRLEGTYDANVSANAAYASQRAIDLERTTRAVVTGNQCRGGRAISVAGGANNQVTANIPDHTDTGLVLTDGASGTVATGNQFLGCRVGLLAWSHERSDLGGNRFVECREHDVVS